MTLWFKEIKGGSAGAHSLWTGSDLHNKNLYLLFRPPLRRWGWFLSHPRSEHPGPPCRTSPLGSASRRRTDTNQEPDVGCWPVTLQWLWVTHPVLQSEDHSFLDVKLHCDFRFAGAHVAVGTGRIQDAWDEQLLPEVGTFVQEDLVGTESYQENCSRRNKSGKNQCNKSLEGFSK